MKIMLIDDEPEIRRLLEKIVEKQEGCQVVASCGDFGSAVAEFAKYHPDVAFVDIDLKGEDGLACARILTELNPKVKIIFATAHNEYMADAFEIYAFDYLVKPFNVERVVRTLERIKGAPSSCAVPEQVCWSGQHRGKLLIKGKEQTWFIDAQDILMIERSEGSTSIVTREEEYKTSVSLSDMEKRLDKRQFMRCHKSYIINLSQISRVEPYGRWTYVVKFKGSGATALITAQNYEAVKKLFD